MTTMTTMTTHTELDITAPAAIWRAAGYTVYSDGSLGSGPHGFEPLLVLGVAATGVRGEPAVAWAMAEDQRRREESARTSALDREASALGALARAIAGASEDKILESILSRVSERTRYAIRQQLGRQ